MTKVQVYQLKIPLLSFCLIKIRLYSVSLILNVYYVTLRYMYHVLTKNTTVTDHNRNLLVETIRSITEILIWGDQNDSSVFE